MKLREGYELRFPPVTHVHTTPSEVVRLDDLTLPEALEVIVRACDELEVARHDIARLRKAGARTLPG
jgi:hypothetical protein